MKKQDIDTTVKSAVAANEKSLIQAIKDAVRDTTLSDSQLAAIRELAAKVGIKSFKDMTSVSRVPPKTPLEKFIAVRMSNMASPAEAADFITKIASSKTQEDLAIALDVPSNRLEKILPTPTLREIFTNLFFKFLVTFFISFCFSFVFKFVSSLDLVKKAMEGCRKYVKLGSARRKVAKSPFEVPNINTTAVNQIQLSADAYPDFSKIDSATQAKLKRILGQADIDVTNASIHSKKVLEQIEAEMTEARDRMMQISGVSPDAMPLAREEYMKTITSFEEAQEAQKQIARIQEQVTDLNKNYYNTPRFSEKYSELSSQLNDVKADLDTIGQASLDAQVASFHTALADRGGKGVVSFEFLDERLKSKVRGTLKDSLEAAEKTQAMMQKKHDMITKAYEEAKQDFVTSLKESGSAPSSDVVKEWAKVNKSYADSNQALEEAKKITEGLREDVANPSFKAFNEARNRTIIQSDKLRIVNETAERIQQESLDARLAINPTNTPEGFHFLSKAEQSQIKKGLDEVLKEATNTNRTLKLRLEEADIKLKEAENYAKQFPDADSAKENLQAVKAMRAELDLKYQESETLIQQARNSRSMPSVVALDNARNKMESFRTESRELVLKQNESFRELGQKAVEESARRQQMSIDLRKDLKSETQFLLALKKDSPAEFAEQLGLTHDYTLGMDFAMKQIGEDPAVWAKVFEANPDLDPLMYTGLGTTDTPEIDVAELRKLYNDTADLIYEDGMPSALSEAKAREFEKDYGQVKDRASFNLLCGAAQWAGFSFLKMFVGYIGKLAGGIAKEYLVQGALPAFITAAAVSILVLGKGVMGTITGLFTKGVGLVLNMASGLWGMITGKSSSKLASARRKAASAARLKTATAAVMDLNLDTSNPDDLVDTTTRGIMEVVKDKLKVVQKFMGQRSIDSMRELAGEIGFATFNKVSQGEEIKPSNPLEKLIYQRVHGAGSAQEKLEFLSGITNAESSEEMQEILGVSEEEMAIYFSGLKTRGQKVFKATMVFSAAFLFSLFAFSIVSSGVFATATASLMATLKPIALYMHSVLGYESAVAFYSAMAVSASKSALISTSIIGIITYGPSWIRKTLGAISSWVGNKISSIWGAIKKGLSYLNPMRYLKKASSIRTRGEALVAILTLPKEVYRAALIRGV